MLEKTLKDVMIPAGSAREVSEHFLSTVFVHFPDPVISDRMHDDNLCFNSGIKVV